MAEGNCDDALNELYTFLDGELTSEVRGQIQQHLDDCSPCLEAFDFEAELRIVVATKCTDEVPASLRTKLLEMFDAVAPEAADGGAP